MAKKHVDPAHSEIAEAAYHRFLKRGGVPGNDFDDWVEAERELRGTPNSQTPTPKATRAKAPPKPRAPRKPKA